MLKRISNDWNTLGNQEEFPAFVDNVLPYLRKWRSCGKRTALATLVAKDGSSPRPIGAQIAVSEDGNSVGYIAGDCFGATLIEEAKSVISKMQNRRIRFGRGSEYIDIRLPCGSGLDIYFDQALDDRVLDDMLSLQKARQTFALRTNFQSGCSTLQVPAQPPEKQSGAHKLDFHRTYLPKLRLVVAGTGPTVYYLSALAATIGFDVKVATPEDVLLERLHAGALPATRLVTPSDKVSVECDAFTAVILAFHNHEWEPHLLARLVESEPFYIGAIGSEQTHVERLSKLEALGVSDEKRSRVTGPVGLIPNSRSPTEIAVSVLAEIVAEARRREMLC